MSNKIILDSENFFMAVYTNDHRKPSTAMNSILIHNVSQGLGWKSPDAYFTYLLANLVKLFYENFEASFTNYPHVNYEQYTATVMKNLNYMLSLQSDEKTPCETIDHSSLLEKKEMALILLKQIMNSLPSNKDWLDPTVEKAARDLLCSDNGESKDEL